MGFVFDCDDEVEMFHRFVCCRIRPKKTFLTEPFLLLSLFKPQTASSVVQSFVCKRQL